MCLVLLMLICATVPALADVASSQWEEPIVMVASFERVIAGGQFIPGLEPGMSAEDVRGAGIPLADEPMNEHKSSDSLVVGTYYNVDQDVIFICERKIMAAPCMQFANDMLLGVDIELPDAIAAENMRAQLNELLGASNTDVVEDDKISVDTWYMGEGDAQMRIGLILQWKENAISHASLQLGYPAVMEKARADASSDK